MVALKNFFLFLKDDEVGIVLKFNNIGGSSGLGPGRPRVFSEEAVGIAALYSCGTWLVIATG